MINKSYNKLTYLLRHPFIKLVKLSNYARNMSILGNGLYE